MRIAISAFLVALALPTLLHAQDQPAVREARALQEAFQGVIAKAESSIACILVSRSDEYKQYGEAPSATPGKLGRFNAQPHLLRLGSEQPETVAAIKALDLSRPDTVPEVFGSGIVLDETGLILTCAHVLRHATKVYVRLPGSRGSYADIHALDPRSDLAVLRLLDPPAGLKPLRLADGDKVRKGQWLVSLANPFAAGFRDGNASASVGIVSNLRRRGPGLANESEAARQPLQYFATLLQTDVRVHRGCSGAPLLNLDGEVVGLSTPLAATVGEDNPAGFAITIDAGIRRIIEVLRRGEEVEYGFLGISMSREVQPGQPVRIMDTIRGGPAALAGLEPGEYIVAIEGRPVRDHEDLLLLVGTGLADHQIKVEVTRRLPDGARRTVNVLLGKAPSAEVAGVIAANRPAAQAGLRVDYTSVLARQREEILPGVAIRAVDEDSPASRALLQAGKVITAVDGKRVTSPASFRRAMEATGKKVQLTVLDASGFRETTVTLEK